MKADKIFMGEPFPGSVIKGLTALAIYSVEPWERGRALALVLLLL